MNLDKTIRLMRLFDVYKGLLTQRQIQILNSYLNYNGSLAEIAQELGTTRQAVLDIVNRTVKRLELFEQNLCFCKKIDSLQKKAQNLIVASRADAKTQQKLINELNLAIKSIEREN